MNKEKLKKIANSIGKVLGTLGLIYVLYTLSQEYTVSSFLEQFTLFSEIMLVLIIFNILSSLLGIYAWHIMLQHYAQKQFAYMTSYYYYAKTEISKYLPGNIFHLVGRQALASKVDLSQAQMAKISFFFFFLLLTGTIISSTIFAFLAKDIPGYILVLLGLSSVISLLISLYLYPSFPVDKKIYMNAILATSVSLQGIVLGIIIMYQSNTFDIELFFQCISIYIVSWLIGFVTPGASGGLGVREGAFIAISTFLHVNIASDIIIFAVLLVRLINIFVDIILYLSTLMLENKIKEKQI